MAKLGCAPPGTSHTASTTQLGQHHGVRARLELVDELLDGDDRALGGEHRLLLHADEPPQLHVAATIGLLGVDDRPTSGLSAGTAVSTSPVNGHVMGASVGVWSMRSVPT